MDSRDAHRRLIAIAAQLACGSMLPDYTDRHRPITAGRARAEVNAAADALREMAVEVRQCADALRRGEHEQA